MNKLKIVLLHNTVAPYRHPLFEKLARKVDLTVLYCSDKPRNRKWESWPHEYDYKHKTIWGFSPMEFNINPSVIWELYKSKADAVIIGGYSKPTMIIAFYFCRLRTIPVVYWTEATEEPKSLLGKLVKPIRHGFYKNSRHIIAQGELTRRYLESQGIPSLKITEAHNCIDEEYFIEKSDEVHLRRDDVRRRYGYDEDDIVFLFVGSLIERKGVIELLEIIAEVSSRNNSFNFIILGSGPLESEVKTTIEGNRLHRVKLIESGIKLQDLIELYSISDVFLFPTLFDLAPLVVNEAMACKLPLLLSDGAGNSYKFIVQGDNGYRIPKGDTRAFIETIEKMDLTMENLERMGKRSREILLERGSSSITASNFVEAICAALNN